jgi:hypothetical protein
MIIEVNQTIPTAAENADYFNALPTLDQERRLIASRRIAPRVMSFSSASDTPVDDSSLAEINHDQPAIIAFADNVSPENRDAVMLGVEFAETVASKKVDIDVDPITYLKEYAEAFRHAGWTMAAGGSEYVHEETKNKSMTMDNLVMEILGSVAGPNAAAVLQLMDLVLQKLQNDAPLTQLFEKNAKRSKKTSFRMIPCLQSSGGAPLTFLLAMDIEGSTQSGGALFWKWNVSSLSIERLAKGVQFTRSAFDRNEQAIKDYLGNDAKSYFSNLPK